MKKTFIGIVIALAVLVGFIWIARPDSGNTSPSAKSNGLLTIQGDGNFDFGSISMAAGKVKHEFKIKNTSSEGVSIDKMYTSCMCTTAMLMMGGKHFGPFGMPGHSAVPKIGQTINPGEEATVEIEFDPAAHGPAGVGLIQRAITIENNAGKPIELTFSATVTP